MVRKNKKKSRALSVVGVTVRDVLKNAEMSVRKEKTKRAKALVIKSLGRLEKAKRIVKKLEYMHEKLLDKDFMDIDIDDYKYDEADKYIDAEVEDEE